MEEELRARLLASSAVTAICGQRITWGRRPQGEALPAIMLTVVSAPREYQLAGPAGLKEARVQVDCWAETYAASKSLARAVNDQLGGARFASVQGAFLDTERDRSDLDAGGKWTHCTSLDFRVWAGE